MGEGGGKQGVGERCREGDKGRRGIEGTRANFYKGVEKESSIERIWGGGWKGKGEGKGGSFRPGHLVKTIGLHGDFGCVSFRSIYLENFL